VANPAEHSAREDARRTGTCVGSDVDRIEAELLAELAGEEAPAGAWLLGKRGPA
jgi:hypothetical protein